jgi:hypothetical protein
MYLILKKGNLRAELMCFKRLHVMLYFSNELWKENIFSLLISQPFLRNAQSLFQAVWFACTHHLHLRVKSFHNTYFGRQCDHHQVVYQYST